MMITKQVLMTMTVTMHVRDTKESTQINRNQIENKISLAVLLVSFCGLTKGISPKMCILCVRVKINKRSFEPFCVWIYRSS